MKNNILLNRINFYPDILFLIIVLVIIGLVVGLYFLIPLLNKKKYEAQRQALKDREETFKANLSKNQGSIIVKGKKLEQDEESTSKEDKSLDNPIEEEQKEIVDLPIVDIPATEPVFEEPTLENTPMTLEYIEKNEEPKNTETKKAPLAKKTTSTTKKTSAATKEGGATKKASTTKKATSTTTKKSTTGTTKTSTAKKTTTGSTKTNTAKKENTKKAE